LILCLVAIKGDIPDWVFRSRDLGDAIVKRTAAQKLEFIDWLASSSFDPTVRTILRRFEPKWYSVFARFPPIMMDRC